MNLDWKAVLALGAVGLVVLFVLEKQAKAAAIAAGQAINPLNNDNVIYGAASKIGDVVAGDGQSVPLGTRIYDWFHPGQ